MLKVPAYIIRIRRVASDSGKVYSFSECAY
jgi:hypothetical protein